MEKSTDERMTRLILAADQNRIQEGARKILESDVQSASESLAEQASFEDLAAWVAILTFWNDDMEGGLMRAISKVVYAPAPDAKKGKSENGRASAKAAAE